MIQKKNVLFDKMITSFTGPESVGRHFCLVK